MPSTEPAVLEHTPSLRVHQLTICAPSGHDIVSEVSLTLHAGEIVALVGESGSGKTTVACGLLAHVRGGATIASGKITLAGSELSRRPEDLQRVRGKDISYVPQDPARALNPLVRIGKQLEEVLVVHRPALSAALRAERVREVLREANLPVVPEFLQRFPHQLSGGQQQRVLVALAFLLRPKVVVLDEPTTALDVASQAKVLETIRQLCARFDSAALYVSHDLAVVGQLADRVMVMYAGRIVETGARAALFAAPRHPYTQALLAAVPNLRAREAPQPIPGLPERPGQRGEGCAFAARCGRRTAHCTQALPPLEPGGPGRTVACFHPLPPTPGERAQRRPPAPVREVRVEQPVLSVQKLRAGYANRRVLEGVSFDIGPAECLALVGESGSGKTTLARALAGVGERGDGELRFMGRPLPFDARARDRRTRGAIQYVFQNPHRALNPRRTVGETLSEARRFFFADAPADPAVRLVLEQVALRPEILSAYPRALSGGEAQRVAIARALVCEPALIICDEITSALDVSVQATILQLLSEMQTKRALSMLFVTHDLGVVRTIADRVVVLHDGKVAESGPTARVLDQPEHAYTRELLRHTPVLG